MTGNTYSTAFQATGNHGNNDFFITCFKNNGQAGWQKVLGSSTINGGAVQIRQLPHQPDMDTKTLMAHHSALKSSAETET